MTPYYEDDAIQLFHGDCRDILPQIGMVDHVITDPPYDEHTHGKQRRGATGRDKRYGLGATISMERHVGFGAIGMTDIAALSALFARISRRWVLCFCAMEQQADWSSALADAGLEHVRFGIWRKRGGTPQFTGDRPGTGSEAIEIAHRPGRKRWNGGGRDGVYECTVVLAGRNGHTDERYHPTQKPISLITELVGDFTDQGETILDPFAGSGTTGVAAKLNGRKAILIEREEKYCEVAAKRLRETEPGRLFDKLPKAKPQSLLAPEAQP